MERTWSGRQIGVFRHYEERGPIFQARATASAMEGYKIGRMPVKNGHLVSGRPLVSARHPVDQNGIEAFGAWRPFPGIRRGCYPRKPVAGFRMSPKRAPEAFVSSALFNLGMGSVILSRFKSDGRVESGVFLLDVFCLGAKNAMFVQLDVTRYENELLERYSPRDALESIEPPCARKLVEDAVRYAAGLGFGPHPDYKKACRVFGGTDTGACTRQFVFGHEGKPHYIQGPNDSPQRVTRILNALEARCGEDNFFYTILEEDLPPDFPDV
jgi:hypothetical protein